LGRDTSWYQDALISSLETSKWEHIPSSSSSSRAWPRPASRARSPQLIRERETDGLKVVLGLATGSTPIFVYQELARIHRERASAFGNVVTFNLDEYFPISPDHAAELSPLHAGASLRSRRHSGEPDSIFPTARFRAAMSRRHASATRSRSPRRRHRFAGARHRAPGHIGFNEPGSSRRSVTRLIHLDRLTRLDAIRDFQSEELVPHTAVTMGVKTILQARRIVIMAFGEHKAAIVARAVEGGVTAEVTATYLQDHENCSWSSTRPRRAGSRASRRRGSSARCTKWASAGPT